MVSERFLELITKDLSGEISPAELAELKRFLIQDESYTKIYNSYKAYWKKDNVTIADDTLAFQKIKDRINKLEAADQLPSEDRPAKNTFFMYWRQIAAGLILLVCASLAKTFFVPAPDTAIVWQQKRTPKGVKLAITLSDGTKVFLNSKSQIKFPTAFNGKVREVFLTGEAYFDVHKDHRHPFIIHTANMNVKVLGTAFDVKAYPEDAISETTLIRGSVEVTMADRPADRIILKPNEKLVINNTSFNPLSGTVSKINLPKDKLHNINATQFTLTSLTFYNKKDTSSIETSWVENKLVFKNKLFTELATQMERWYGYNIQFKKEQLKQLRFTASFEKETVSEALDALRLTEDFRYKIVGATIYIY
ncbi:FecR family protein [Mucilaginibacter sp.]|jgi:ferric-dicitrate binding protein FerR (iron transport regulator)|uniref:FecR family protein n=1 Tax=Mucilaginibacter sp. TaxID=1882438 RepID=UPI00356543F4